MNDLERSVNRELHTLDEAHRLGRITREEYRSRRRHTLHPLYDNTGTTARNDIVKQSPRSRGGQGPAGGSVLPMLFPSRPGTVWTYVGALAIVLILGMLLAYWFLRGG